jgi:hypothetical protein
MVYPRLSTTQEIMLSRQCLHSTESLRYTMHLREIVDKTTTKPISFARIYTTHGSFLPYISFLFYSFKCGTIVPTQPQFHVSAASKNDGSCEG